MGKLRDGSETYPKPARAGGRCVRICAPVYTLRHEPFWVAFVCVLFILKRSIKMTTIRLNDSAAKELKSLCFRTDSYEKVIAMLITSFKRYDPRWGAMQALKAAIEE